MTDTKFVTIDLSDRRKIAIIGMAAAGLLSIASIGLAPSAGAMDMQHARDNGYVMADDDTDQPYRDSYPHDDESTESWRDSDDSSYRDDKSDVMNARHDTQNDSSDCDGMRADESQYRHDKNDSYDADTSYYHEGDSNGDMGWREDDESDKYVRHDHDAQYASMHDEDAYADRDMNRSDWKHDDSMKEWDATHESDHQGDVVNVVSDEEKLTTLTAAVQAAGLVEALQADGPYTVFAPTNNAFEQLPEGTVETLLKPENKSMLSNVLLYHVVAGNYDSKDLRKMAKHGETLTTLSGEELSPVLRDKKLMLMDASGAWVSIKEADMYADNGIVHVIRNVLMA